MSNFLIWHKTNFATLTTNEINTLKTKMLKSPTMSMDIFKKVLGNIDKNYPFSMSPKLILALLVLTGICTIGIGILTNVAVPQLLQTPPDELVLPPVLVPKLQLEKPLTNISVPYHATHMEPLPSTSTDYKSEPLSLEMFNRAATDLNEKGVIYLKKYKKYLYKPPH